MEKNEFSLLKSMFIDKMAAISECIKSMFTDCLITTISKDSPINYEELSILIDFPNIMFNLDEYRRKVFANSLIDAVIHYKLTFEQFDSVCLRLKTKAVFEIQYSDFTEYFNKENDWDNASGLFKLLARTEMSCHEKIEFLRYMPGIIEKTYGSGSDYEKNLYKDIAAGAEQDEKVMSILYSDKIHIIGSDLYEYYAVICMAEFDKCDGNRYPNLLELCMDDGTIIRFKRGSKCSDLLAVTVRSIAEGISRAEYYKQIEAVCSGGGKIIASTSMGSNVSMDKTVQIESALNIIEMVSNDIAALSLEAERINTCVRDAKATLM